MRDERFPRGKFHFTFDHVWHVGYLRCANFAAVDLGWVHVRFPMPWLPQAAYSRGWDAGWMEGRREINPAKPEEEQGNG